jgi:hypothetical protein
MALLNTQQPNENMPVEQEEPVPGQEAQGGEGSLTITADQVGEEIMKQADPNQQQAIKQAVNAGMKMLFGKDTHNQLFDAIRPEDQVPLADELGAGATNLMLLMYAHSKQTMPPDAIVPAGTILLAKACEFINESGMAAVTDEDYSQALELFVVSIQDKLDPEFRQKNGLQQRQDQQAQQAQPQAEQLAPQAQPGGGMLNMGRAQ